MIVLFFSFFPRHVFPNVPFKIQIQFSPVHPCEDGHPPPLPRLLLLSLPADLAVGAAVTEDPHQSVSTARRVELRDGSPGVRVLILVLVGAGGGGGVGVDSAETVVLLSLFGKMRLENTFSCLLVFQSRIYCVQSTLVQKKSYHATYIIRIFHGELMTNKAIFLITRSHLNVYPDLVSDILGRVCPGPSRSRLLALGTSCSSFSARKSGRNCRQREIDGGSKEN